MIKGKERNSQREEEKDRTFRDRRARRGTGSKRRGTDAERRREQVCGGREGQTALGRRGQAFGGGAEGGEGRPEGEERNRQQ